MKAMIFGRANFSRWLFVAGNLAFVALVVFGLVLPVITFFSERDEQIANQRDVLARLRGIVAQEASIQAMASDTKAQFQTGEFLNGPNDNVVGADLQTRIRGLTEGAGTRWRAVQALPVKTADQLRYVGSRIEVAGPLPSIQRAVYAIETAKPYLFVTAATLRNASVVTRPGVAEEPVITAQLDIYGALQPAGQD